MSSLKKSVVLVVGMLGMLLLPMASGHAGMVGTDEVLYQRERAQLADRLEREDVRQQLIELGVDPAAAKARVHQMTNEEVAALNGQIATLPAGAGLNTTELLLVIIILILLL